MSAKVKVSGSWKEFASGKVKVGGSWKTLDKGYVKVGGSWKQFYVREIATTTTITTSNVTWPTDLTVSGTVSPAPTGGTITIKNGATVLASGVTVNTTTGAYSTTIDLNAGSYSSLTATFSGHDIYLTSVSSSTSATIAKANTSISASLSATTINQGGSTTISGSLGIAGQTVYIDYSGGGNVTSTTTDGSGNYAVALYPGNGTTNYVARYDGSTNYNGSTSGAVSVYTRTYYTATYNPGITGNNYEFRGAGSDIDQISTYFVMPASGADMRIYNVSIAVAGSGGESAIVRGAIWTDGGGLVGYSGQTTIGSAAGSSNLAKVNFGLSAPVSGNAGYLIGFWHINNNTSYTTQWSFRDNQSGATSYHDNTSPADITNFTKSATVGSKTLLFTFDYEYYA